MKIYTVIKRYDGGYGEVTAKEISYLTKEDAEKFFNYYKEKYIYGSKFNGECLFKIIRDDKFHIDYNDKGKWHYSMWINVTDVHASFSTNDYLE